ncbi:phosphate/phosphite/phosphonate ABC transporter substrate-binding protein [Ohtaekwangia koreensis]|uniref:Phosphonate transport system substrate-binding protein n=1 Tax=Ohtaekwangia koreensis TaxID=688867 RepID=A0A1T5MJT9_9BACT|nr:phosphate/phosphite/phosphonate ABC transporter substrate-binding protein [Ohtaekwangia koreensis]SKC88472.1 phosphonate transport system substrate-binding protein [Ohtaekwangia koreensis]
MYSTPLKNLRYRWLCPGIQNTICIALTRHFFVLLFSLCVVSLQAQQSQTINFYLTPSISAELLNKNGTFIKDFLEKETGLSIKMVIPSSYDEMVDYFGADGSCFAIMSSQSYILANKKHGAVVKLRTVRFGHSVYYGQILTRASSGIKTIKDLQGKSIAYTDELSTSGYLYPKKMLEKNNVKPSKEIFAKKHDEVVKLVYEGKVDAGAAFYSPPATDGTLRDARVRIKDKYPDVEQKVITLVKTDAIPNDPIVFSKNFDPEAARKLYVALVKLASEAKGKQTLLELYGTEGFVKASDADYNSLRVVMGVTR